MSTDFSRIEEFLTWLENAVEGYVNGDLLVLPLREQHEIYKNWLNNDDKETLALGIKHRIDLEKGE